MLQRSHYVAPVDASITQREARRVESLCVLTSKHIKHLATAGYRKPIHNT